MPPPILTSCAHALGSPLPLRIGLMGLGGPTQGCRNAAGRFPSCVRPREPFTVGRWPPCSKDPHTAPRSGRCGRDLRPPATASTSSPSLSRGAALVSGGRRRCPGRNRPAKPLPRPDPRIGERSVHCHVQPFIPRELCCAGRDNRPLLLAFLSPSPCGGQDQAHLLPIPEEPVLVPWAGISPSPGPDR